MTYPRIQPGSTAYRDLLGTLGAPSDLAPLVSAADRETAEKLAGDLSLDVYRIDLAAIISKYIGETEKNLDRLSVDVPDGSALVCVQVDEVADRHLGPWMRQAAELASLVVLVTRDPEGLRGKLPAPLRAHVGPADGPIT